MRMLIRRSAIETVFVEVYGMIIVIFGNVICHKYTYETLCVEMKLGEIFL